MATNTLIIKDGNGSLSALSANSASTGLIPEHFINGATNLTASVTASAASPVYVTGNVSVNQPINVDVVVGDSIAVTSSISAPLYVSSSAGSPLLVTASSNIPVYIGNTLTVTASSNLPVQVNGTINVSASSSEPVYVTGAVAVTSSAVFPVYVTGSVQSSVTVADGLRVTSSLTNPLVVSNLRSTSVSKNSYGVAYSVNYGNETSGTFMLADSSSTRQGLAIFNEGASNLYISIGSGSTNGFTIASTGSAPNMYSFVLYASGTYIADYTTAGLFHAGFYVSSSTVTGKAFVTETT